MNVFEKKLKEKLDQSKHNAYGEENYDQYRFGPYPGKNTYRRMVVNAKTIVKKALNYNQVSLSSLMAEYGEQLEHLYNLLDDEESKSLMTDLMAYRCLGFKKVKLPLSNESYWKTLENVGSLVKSDQKIDPNFKHFILEDFDLSPKGYDVKLFFTKKGVATDFIIEQYAYKRNNAKVVHAEKGDTVFDLGACWGDTALYFAHEAGQDGKVFSFEFIPNNIKIFKKNVELNPHLVNNIQLVEAPVSDVSDEKFYYLDNGPGSSIKMEPFKGMTGETTSVTIDKVVADNNVKKVDFIKMDIEGAEPAALRGAEKTIRKYRPKLAIAIYHSLDDFVNIPAWIKSLDLGYEFYLGHYTIHKEETILFAKPV